MCLCLCESKHTHVKRHAYRNDRMHVGKIAINERQCQDHQMVCLEFHINNNKHSTSYTIDRANCYGVLQYIQLYTHIVVQRAYRIVCFVFIHTYGESFCIQAGKLKQRIPTCCESLHMLYPQFRIDKFQVIKSSSVHDFQVLLMISTDSDKDCPAVYASCRLSSVMSECVCVSVCVFCVFSNLYIDIDMVLNVCSASSEQML